MAIDNRIDQKKLPKHVAVIMDGNGRWAKQRGKLRTFGHNKGVKAVRETVECAAEMGIEHLTLYAFSTENWNRPQREINALMTLLVKTINKETKTLNDNNIRLNAIGDLKSLPKSCLKELNEAIENTKGNTRMTLTLALSYSSRWELVEAVKTIAINVKTGKLDVDSIDESVVDDHLCTLGIPDPELLIRTSGEQRISNFLLWQIAYAELYFTDKLWPDFDRHDFEAAIIDYQGRERRFGKISEQVSA
ncbi:MAG: isoprenyl transferase [Flavobacteriales bacterium]|nr:isoprenyl transferase [Flavobacteriales bacterium]MCB9192395.1 isoprenyl transferase [Flavobacteriales bacterium]MCB9204483.1 isoprenyl transferase [Flavobacteriales bacterium]